MAKRDPNLPHQPIISFSGGSLTVSCNCRVTVGQHEKAGKLIYSPIGSSKDYKETRWLYNDPDNHWAEFTEEDKIR